MARERKPRENEVMIKPMDTISFNNGTTRYEVMNTGSTNVYIDTVSLKARSTTNRQGSISVIEETNGANYSHKEKKVK